jgi:L-threonylcarbamoyladenylate synthase
MTASLENALSCLNSGGVVAIPTETVYGLAADARSDVAVAKVFALKGRPSTNPLIVHVSSVEVAERYAVLDDRSRRLFAAFSPGPLTIVLPSRGVISKLVTAGLDTVGLRIPDHPLALELLRTFDGPLAAPSANKSNHVSPTTAEHVRSAFGEAVSVLDGGPCRVGIESTVLSLAAAAPMILRPGAISRNAIESVIGPVDVFAGSIAPITAAASPGQQERHYAPVTPAFRIERATTDRIDFPVLELPADPDEAARVFYARLRELDATRPAAILIEMPPDEPRWTALRDRIERATRPYGPHR